MPFRFIFAPFITMITCLAAGVLAWYSDYRVAASSSSSRTTGSAASCGQRDASQRSSAAASTTPTYQVLWEKTLATTQDPRGKPHEQDENSTHVYP